MLIDTDIEDNLEDLASYAERHTGPAVANRCPLPETTQRGVRGWVILLKRGVLPVDPMRVASTPSEGVLPHVSARAPPSARPVPSTVHSASLAVVAGPAHPAGGRGGRRHRGRQDPGGGGRPRVVGRRGRPVRPRPAGQALPLGADGPKSFDCSGLVQTSYRAAGVHLPRVSRQQYGAGKLVSLKHLRAGDLLFYAKDTSDRRTIYHVGMYLGAGRMVEAPNRRAPVRIASIWRPGLLAKATRPAAGVRGMLSVELGEHSKAVAAVQQRLAANRRCVTVDGEFGPQTRRALIAFQRQHGITPDGVVGRGTWGKLVANGRQRSPAKC